MKRSFMKKSLVVIFFALLAFAVYMPSVMAAAVGQAVVNPNIRDANDKPATIPDFGTHVIAVTYADSGVSDLGDPINDAMKAKNYSKAKYRGLGVANMKDSTAPNFLIRQIVKGKIEKYKSTILTDVDNTLAKTWNLGNCKGSSVFVLVGKDKTIKYIRYTTKAKPWTQTDIDAVLKIVDELVK